MNRKLSSTPDPIDPQESEEFTPGHGAPKDSSRAHASYSRANTADDHVRTKPSWINLPARRAQSNGETRGASVDFLLPTTASTPKDRHTNNETHACVQDGARVPLADRTHVPKNSEPSSRKSTVEGVVQFKKSPRQSTGLTSASASFEETEAWDRKAILTLVMLQAQLIDNSSLMVKNRWWRNSRLFQSLNSSRTHDQNCRSGAKTPSRSRTYQLLSLVASF